MDSKAPKLLDQVRETLRVKHYSYRTEQTYLDWIKRFIIFHNKRHPKEMGAAEVQERSKARWMIEKPYLS